MSGAGHLPTQKADLADPSLILGACVDCLIYPVLINPAGRCADCEPSNVCDVCGLPKGVCVCDVEVNYGPSRSL